MTINKIIRHTLYAICAFSAFLGLFLAVGCSKGDSGGDNPPEPSPEIKTPVVATASVVSITASSASCGGNVTSSEGATVTARGVVWGASENPTLESCAGRTSDGDGTGAFTSSITGLSASTAYYVRAYATNSAGTAYGEQKAFTSGGQAVIPVVTTTSVTGITESSASGGGDVTSDGGAAVTARGVVWSKSENPTLESCAGKTSDGEGYGAFTSYIYGLSASTTYYVRAYATNSAGTAYGEQKSFSTRGHFVKTASVSCVTEASAICGGEVNYHLDGTRGVVWSKSENPTLESCAGKTSDGEGYGAFTSYIYGLSASTTYYVRAYVITPSETAYGEQKSFSTSAHVEATDLSASGVANCYIVSQAGSYKFKAVKGNSAESVGTPAWAEVLWESFGTDAAPAPGDVVCGAFFSDGYVTFNIRSPFNDGNAVIAVRDASGTILWSWHIWCTSEKINTQAYGGAVVLDRNLGALSVEVDNPKSFGLFYQWGRKDPFLGSYRADSLRIAASAGKCFSTVESSSSTGTIQYAVENPMTSISYSYQNQDWFYTGTKTTDNTRWQPSKTIYDPCPAGYRVPDGGPGGLWSSAGFSESTFPEAGVYHGRMFTESSAYYPAAGAIVLGLDCWYAGYGFYWSCTPTEDVPTAKYMGYDLIYYTDGVDADSCHGRSWGCSVRCVAE